MLSKLHICQTLMLSSMFCKSAIPSTPRSIPLLTSLQLSYSNLIHTQTPSRRHKIPIRRTSQWKNLAIVTISPPAHNAAHYAPKERECAHKLSPCPSCHADLYMRQRIKKAVTGALKRLGVCRTKSFLFYLGTSSWTPVCEHLAAKRHIWNAKHPHAPMTLTNFALDHIRPVREFQKKSFGAQTLLCNHYTNLQPLLFEDNTWKGDSWSARDEEHWHENIILQPHYLETYYPESAPTQPSLLAEQT